VQFCCDFSSTKQGDGPYRYPTLRGKAREHQSQRRWDSSHGRRGQESHACIEHNIETRICALSGSERLRHCQESELQSPQSPPLQEPSMCREPHCMRYSGSCLLLLDPMKAGLWSKFVSPKNLCGQSSSVVWEELCGSRLWRETFGVTYSAIYKYRRNLA
jgi:hypothetical protein